MTDAERQARSRALRRKALWDSDRDEIEKLRAQIREIERKAVEGDHGAAAKITLNLADGRTVTSDRKKDEST